MLLCFNESVTVCNSGPSQIQWVQSEAGFVEIFPGAETQWASQEPPEVQSDHGGVISDVFSGPQSSAELHIHTEPQQHRQKPVQHQTSSSHRWPMRLPAYRTIIYLSISMIIIIIYIYIYDKMIVFVRCHINGFQQRYSFAPHIFLFV